MPIALHFNFEKQLFPEPVIPPPLTPRPYIYEFQNANDMSVNLSIKSRKITNG